MELSCRTCGHTVYVERGQARGLGKPYVRCANCKAMILVGGRSEWQLKSASSRLGYASTCCCPALLLPLLLTTLVWIGFWLSARHTGSSSAVAMVVTCVVVLVVGLAVTVPLALRKLGTEIAKSRRRMQNKDYQQKLKHMGLLK